MKAAYSFLYILSFILYLYLGNFSKFSGGLQIITQLVFIIVLIQFAKDRKVNSKMDMLLFNYIIYLTFSRIVLTLILTIATNDFAKIVTYWYSHAVLASFILLNGLLFLKKDGYRKL